MPRLNLEQQRKRARALLNAARAQDPGALRRFASSGLHSTTPLTVSLHNAQRIIARENGFASWANMKARICAETLRQPFMLSALLAASHRALETEFPRPLYRDALARPLAGEVGWSALAATQETRFPGYGSGPDPFVSIVTRFFDDALRDAVARRNITQGVILGAGMDTRAFRLAWPRSMTMFEVDRSDVFEHKETVLGKAHARASCRRQIVASDPRGSWTTALLKAGFDSKRRSAVFIADLMYFDICAAERLLQDITAIATRGSWIGFALPTQQTLDSVFMAPFLRRIETLGLPPWQLGLDDPDAWLSVYDWAATSVVVGAPEASYNRWPYAYIPRETPAVPRVFFTQASLGRKED